MKTRITTLLIVIFAVANNSYAQLQPTLNIYKDGKILYCLSTSEIDSIKFEKNPYNGHEYVDLGLSVKWATCNVGASSPEDTGYYFAWGETSPKSTYDWSTYKYCNGTNKTLTKYCTDSYYGTVDNKTELDLSDDAAHVNWGGNWRMPTHKEFLELIENCSYEVLTILGDPFIKVIGPNGNFIFMPDIADYWTTSGSGGDGAYAFYYHFRGGMQTTGSGRNNGYYIRPVCP
ncbi:MAG: DUF1566 domain-containing protein [Bacteroidales bacterium]|nr:DUF1566 domain-containing protein [Bacteroidales bacterium]MBQ7818889.1 DUF1566 domain-containing protein [Bacteroidales bacterium]